tara:strand:- start:150 stop:539 length:390 start_codon:yes stop_codon:yes gene_type:complete
MSIILNLIALFVVLFLYAEFVTFLTLLGRKCSACGSRKTWTWKHETRDVSYSDIKHINTNRYCFSCCDFTTRDDFAFMSGDLESDPFYKIALRHMNKNNPMEEGEGVDFQSPNCTIKIGKIELGGPPKE